MAAPNTNTSSAILPSGLTPLNYLLQGQQRSDMLSRSLATRRAQRDRNLSRLFEVSPDKTWDPAKREVEDLFNSEVRDWTTSQLNAGVSHTDENFLNNRAKRIAYANTIAAENRHIGEKYKNSLGLAEKGQFYKKDIISALHDVVFDEEGNYKGSNNVDMNAFERILQGKEYLDENEVLKDFTENLPEIVDAYYQEMVDRYGNRYFENRNIKRSVFADEPGPDGKPKIIVNDDLLNVAMQHDELSKILEGEEDPKAKLRQLLAGRAKYEEKVTPGRQITNPDDDGDGGEQKLTPADWTRYQTLRAAIYSRDEKAIAAATNIIEGVSVSFIKGSALDPKDRSGLKWDPDSKGIVVNIAPKNYEDTPKRIVLPLRTPEEQEKALFYLSQLIDENLPSKYKLGSDKLTQLHDEYNQNVTNQIKDMSDQEIADMINKENPDASPEEKLAKFKELKGML